MMHDKLSNRHLVIVANWSDIKETPVGTANERVGGQNAKIGATTKIGEPTSNYRVPLILCHPTCCVLMALTCGGKPFSSRHLPERNQFRISGSPTDIRVVFVLEYL
jgi:hypothetical protein